VLAFLKSLRQSIKNKLHFSSHPHGRQYKIYDENFEMGEGKIKKNEKAVLTIKQQFGNFFCSFLP
jgi:hypothetical protein